MTDKHAENRQHPRFDEPVCTWLEFGSEHAAYSTVTKDVGECGARLSAQHAIHPGDTIRLSLQIEGGPITVMGNVAWARMGDDGICDFGVQFANDDSAAARRLKKLAAQDTVTA